MPTIYIAMNDAKRATKPRQEARPQVTAPGEVKVVAVIKLASLATA
jgi:hypothetical protein